MIRGLAHVGVAVRALEPAIERWKRLGFVHESTETLDSMGLRLAFLRAGDAVIELLEPTRPETAIAKFLEKRGEGIHHVALWVDDMERALADAADAGLELIDSAPRAGSHETEVAFLHPRALAGVLVEFCRKKPA
jgi:methylmalonyl-CoA/ethylmalonyl-CoA epimerase